MLLYERKKEEDSMEVVERYNHAQILVAIKSVRLYPFINTEQEDTGKDTLIPIATLTFEEMDFRKIVIEPCAKEIIGVLRLTGVHLSEITEEYKVNEETREVTLYKKGRWNKVRYLVFGRIMDTLRLQYDWHPFIAYLMYEEGTLC